MSVETQDDADKTPRHDTRDMPVTRGAMRKAFRINEVFTFLVAALTAIAAVFGAYKLLLNEAAAAGERASGPLIKRVETLEQNDKQRSEDIHEVQTDIRALYKAVMTKQPQERLEKPAPAKDGGP
jgi:hypothetical protein